MSTTTNEEKLRQYEKRFSLIVELMLSLDSSSNMVREVKNLSPNFK